jgi:PKD repeat protein
LAPDSDEVVVKIDGKHLIASFLIIIISFFIIVSYVNALTSYLPSFVSPYGSPRPPPPIISYPPVAEAGPDQDVIIYEVVFFNGSGSIDIDGKIKSYSWSFGDGTNASGVEVYHKYTSEGTFTAILTVKDNLGMTDTDTSVIIVSMPTFEEFSRLPIEDSVTIFEMLPTEDSKEILMNINSSYASEIFEGLNVSVAQKIVNAALLTNYSTDTSVILLGIEKEYVAEVIRGLDTELGVELIESIMGVNATGCANIVESAVIMDLNNSVNFLERLDDELLAELLLNMAGLPSTPSTVATIFESLSIEKVLAVVKKWISFGELLKLEEVFGFLKQETLNSIYELLSVAERVAIYPFLSTDTVSLIRRELLPLPEIGSMPITISRLGSRGYNVSMMIYNHGNIDIGNFSGEFWIEGDLVDIFEVSDLPADSSTEISFIWTPTSKGVYALGAFLDPENLIEEIDETNNEVLLSYGVELPELMVAFETVPTEFIEGTPYVLEIAVLNTGEEKAEDFEIELQASGIIIEQGRVRWTSFTIGSSEVDELPAGTTRVFEFSWEPEVAGAYTFTAKVDPQEQVLEADRTNNKVGLQIEVEERPKIWPYLLISAVIVVAVIGILFLVRPQTFDFLRQLNLKKYMKKNYSTRSDVQHACLPTNSFLV